MAVLTQSRLAAACLATATLTALAVQTLAHADAPQHYPYDPVCPWGRLADGHGMLIRCMQPSEASTLLASDVAKPTPPAGTAKAVAAADSNAKPTLKQARRLGVVQMGPAQADAGELPLAERKLAAVKEKFVACVEANGGVTAEPPRVVLRFLVREKGIAEGVTVKSSSGMTKQAADCIASVVDRRYVGYPAAPIVGATFPIELGWSSTSADTGR